VDLEAEVVVLDEAGDGLTPLEQIGRMAFPGAVANNMADLRFDCRNRWPRRVPGAHLAGGERVAPIAQAFLAFGAKLAGDLSADAVVWNPARLVSEPGFFVETVNDYVGGGAFPVLATVDFEYHENEYRLQSQGLAWFSGQEIALAGAGAQGQELARRAVRLIHDIAVNGPIIMHQYVADLDTDLQIELAPTGEANSILNCHIRSKSDAKGKALTLH